MKMSKGCGKTIQEEKKDDISGGKEGVSEVHNGWFRANSRYMTISLYALFVIICGTVAAMLIINWSSTKAFIMQLLGVLSPFLIALLIAYFLLPIVEVINEKLEKYVTKGRYKKPVRYLSILLAYILVLGFIVIAFVFVIPQVGQSLRELSATIPAMYNKVSKYLMELQEKYPGIDMEIISKKLSERVPDLVNLGTNVMGNVLPFVYSLSMSVMRLVINIIFAIIISVYMIVSKDMFRQQAKRLVYAIFNEKRGDMVCRTCRECNDIFSAFLISKAIDSLIIGCLCCIIMNLLGLPYAVLLSVIVGITNMIPYFGPFIGAVPGVLIFLCTDFTDAVIFAIMILILQQFDGLVLGPRLLGQSTGLNPIWVIFGITVGGAYFGVVGMFIGVPVVAVLAFLMNKLIVYRLHGKAVGALEEFCPEEKASRE